MVTQTPSGMSAHKRRTRLTQRTVRLLRLCIAVAGSLAGLQGGTPALASPSQLQPQGAVAGEVRPIPKPEVVFEYNRGVVMSDGLTLRANVFRPAKPGRYPVIVTHGLYGKDVA